ncbi:MAG: hypothetical protein HGA87_05835 [Desulfobulbaceae bacterium]|nr:hypothetical protein [Desulfobulbaceae bacterium]
MNKYKVIDACAIVITLVVFVVITVTLPSFWAVILRAGIGFLISAAILGLYLLVRPNKELIELEMQIMNIASNAKQIQKFARDLKPEADHLGPSILNVSVEIAKLAGRILSREFKHMAIEIRRLDSYSGKFADLCSFIASDGPYLRRNELFEQITELENNWIPDSLKVIEEISASIDANQAKKLVLAESELRLIANIYKGNSAAHEAAELLQQILSEKE